MAAPSSPHRILRATLLSAVLGLALAATHPSLAAAPVSPITVEAVRNAEFRNVYAGKGIVRLKGGRFEEPVAPGVTARLRVRLDEHVALGDLDGDGLDDAAVVIISEPAAGGAFFDLAAVVNRAGAPVHVATKHLGGRVAVQELAIEKGRIRLRMLVWQAGQTDAEVPGSSLLREYVLAGSRLEEAKPPL